MNSVHFQLVQGREIIDMAIILEAKALNDNVNRDEAFSFARVSTTSKGIQYISMQSQINGKAPSSWPW